LSLKWLLGFASEAENPYPVSRSASFTVNL
jgi:hypothetical protein